MNDQLEEKEFLQEDTASNFKLSIPKSLTAALIVIICLQLIASVINIPAFFKQELYHLTLPLSFLVGGGLSVVILIPFVKTNWNSIQSHLFQPTQIILVALSILFYIFMLPVAEFFTSLVPTEGISWLEEFYKQLIQSCEMVLDYKIAGFITVCILAPIL